MDSAAAWGVAGWVIAVLEMAGIVVYLAVKDSGVRFKVFWSKPKTPRTAHSDDTRQFVIPEELAKAAKAKRVRKGKGKVVELVKG